MALDKAIKSGKEKRKPYRGAKSFDPSCRNHKGCPACVNNRMYSMTKRLDKAVSQEKEG